jgi:hypothetical protein
MEVKQMCRVNFSGFWELEHLPYSGGFYEQPAPELDEILLVKDTMNRVIHAKKEREKKNK